MSNVSKGYADFDDGYRSYSVGQLPQKLLMSVIFSSRSIRARLCFKRVTLLPNWELNERNTIVAFGAFGKRKPSESDAVYPVRLDIVEDATPLLLVGPGGQEFNAVGLTWTSPDTTGYGAGPILVGAKLNVAETSPGRRWSPLIEQNSAAMPNDEVSLYGAVADFRIRVLTSGGSHPTA